MDQTQRPTPEKRQNLPTPEHAPDFELSPEGRPAGAAEEKLSTASVVTPPPVPAITPPGAADTVPSMHQRIEEILSEDLAPMYAKLDPAAQQTFKAEGEKAASAIENLLQTARIHIGKIVGIIIGWLRLLPGVNEFYLEQEAKMKAAKLIALKQKPPGPL